ncbi:MAG: OmpA/MotB family protein [Planctomycetota bacterium]
MAATWKPARIAVAALLLAGTGCVTGALVDKESDGILAVRNDIAELKRQLAALRAEIRRAEVEEGPKVAAEKQAQFAGDLSKAGLRVTSRGPEVVVTLASTILFGPGEVSVRKDGREPLLALAKSLAKRFPDRFVRVDGHTDSSPPRRVARAYPTNWDLSIARALAIVRFLTEEGELPRERVFAAAYGHYRPVSDNETPSGRDANRRVDIVVLPPVRLKKVSTAELAR